MEGEREGGECTLPVICRALWVKFKLIMCHRSEYW